MWDKCLQHVTGLPVCRGHKLHFRWGRQQWDRVLFSNESRFNLSHHDGRIRVFRRRGERFADNCLIENDRFGGGSVIVWGGIVGRRKINHIVVQGNLNAQGYINQILQPEAVPFLQKYWPVILMHDNARPCVARICRQFLNRNNVNVLPWPTMSWDMNPIEHIWDYLGRKFPAILMNDNARPHVARICRQFLNRNYVNVLPWPAVSPDMNPIEHIWDYLGRMVRARGNVHNLRDLENALIQELNNIPNVVIRRYVRSMRGRLAACINSRGGHTRY